jgi:hypothetical protein
MALTCDVTSRRRDLVTGGDETTFGLDPFQFFDVCLGLAGDAIMVLIPVKLSILGDRGQ